MRGMAAAMEMTDGYINMLAQEVLGARPGSYFAKAQAAELAILEARRDVRDASQSLERVKRTQMIEDAQRPGSVEGRMFMLADSHKTIVRYSRWLAQSQDRLAQAYAQRLPVKH